MSSDSWRPISRLMAIAAVDLLICAAGFEWYRRTVGVELRLFLVHVPLVVAVIAGSLLLATPLVLWPRLARQRLTPYLVAAVPALAVAGMMFLYVANTATNVWVDGNVTHREVWLWVADRWNGGTLIGSSLLLPAVTLGLLAVFLVPHLVLAAPVHRGLTALAALGLSMWPPVTRRRQLAAVVAFVIAGGYAAFFYELSWRTSRSNLLSSDPILAFLRTDLEVRDDEQLAGALRFKQEGLECRAAYPRGQTFERKHVVVVVVDALRADHTSVYGYSRQTTPFLSELVRDGRLRKVDFAVSLCASSACGIKGTLTSKVPHHQVPDNFSVQDLLHDQGYATYVIGSGNHSYRGQQEQYGSDLTLFFDGRQSARYHRADDRVILEGLERVPDRGGPSFFYFHLMSSHLAGIKHSQYELFTPAQLGPGPLYEFIRGGPPQEVMINYYDNGVIQADAMIRQLFGELDRKGYLENSLIVVMSDHGEALGERGPSYYGHGATLYQELIRIPLLISHTSAEKHPLRFGDQLDVAPTLVDLLGLPAPSCWEGVSLLRSSAKEATTHQTRALQPCHAVIDRSTGRIYKYIACGRVWREELYDLTSDPGERINLIAGAPADLVEGLRARLRRRSASP